MSTGAGNFTAYDDKSGSRYNGTNLHQFNIEIDFINTRKKSISGLESVVLSSGPFAYSTESYSCTFYEGEKT